ncbi:hypothetical protein AAGG74_15265 [Bacillus mexicanus]|uniref:hypothetical protein n=1 Tax=Bacillus mexicanus TaxID=2834415 RepID=UPI003D1ABA43
MKPMEYEKYETGSYKFISSKNKVVVYVDDKVWGVPQGDRFLAALLNDIKKYKEKIKRLETELYNKSKSD